MPFVGALVMWLLFFAELIGAIDLQMMGIRDAEVQKLLLDRFGRLLIVQQAEVLAVYTTIGACYGAAMAVLVAIWERALDWRVSQRRRTWIAAVGTLLLESWQVMASLIRYPQLFNELLYAKGGWRRSLQVALTEHVSWRVLQAGGALLLLCLFVGPALSKPGRIWIGNQLRRSLWRSIAISTVLVLLVYAFVHRSANHWPAALQNRPNILLIAIDSLRADRVGPGHETITPRLSQLAAQGVQFDAAYVTVPRTFPSWITLLSGRWPHHHKIRHMFPSAEERRAIGPLLPGVLAQQGYFTAVVSDFAGELFSRLEVGFQLNDVPHFDATTIAGQVGLNLHWALVPYLANKFGHRVATSLGSIAENADPDRLADRIIARLHEQSERGPFFMTTFFSTAHFPYAAPDPYYRRFTDPNYRGRFRYLKPLSAFSFLDGKLTADDVAQVRALYDGSVASVDAAVGRVVDELDTLGIADRTIVVLLADHGENLYEESRGMGHGDHVLGDKPLHIPFVIRDPVHHFPPHRVPGIVRDVDIAPTLAALVGTSLTKSPDGVDLHPLLAGKRADLNLIAFSESELWCVPEGPGFRPDERLPYPALPALITLTPDSDIVLAPDLQDVVVVAKHRALRTDRWRLHYAPTRHGVRWSLYDLAVDPNEQSPLAGAPELFALQAQLYRWMTEDGSAIENGFVVPR